MHGGIVEELSEPIENSLSSLRIRYMKERWSLWRLSKFDKYYQSHCMRAYTIAGIEPEGVKHLSCYVAADYSSISSSSLQQLSRMKDTNAMESKMGWMRKTLARHFLNASQYYRWMQVKTRHRGLYKTKQWYIWPHIPLRMDAMDCITMVNTQG